MNLDTGQGADAIGEIWNIESQDRGYECRSAAPALIRCLQDPDSRVRGSTASALVHIRPNTTDTVRDLPLALENADLSVRESAL